MLSSSILLAARRALASALVGCAGFAVCMHAARAQSTQPAQSEQQLINWYYAAVFGTGVYSAGDRTVSVLQLPFSYRIRESDYSERRWGVRFRMPVTFGFYDFKFADLAGGDLPESVSTASVLPGVEGEVWVSQRWRLQPFAYVGYGWELDGPNSATLYSLGVKSRFSVPLKDGEMVLGATFNHAGYIVDGERKPFTALAVGADFYFPTRATVRGQALEFGMHFAAYYYVDGLIFPMADNIDNTERSEREIGVSLRVRKPLDFKLFSADMVGLGFVRGDNVTAVRLFFGLPY